MMHPVERLVPITVDGHPANPERGTVRWDEAKIIWFGGHILATLTAFFVFSWSAFALFLVSSWLLVLLGHSVGYHRLLMHGNFRTHPWLGRALILCGALLGATGPTNIIRVHDERDWAQRAPNCHPYYSQHVPFFRDMAWQLFARIDLDHPPQFTPDPHWAKDPFIHHLDRWWRLYALAPAIPLGLIGGWGWIVWGVSARIIAINAGHWAVNHICHHPGLNVRHWDVPANGVAASDLAPAGPITGFLLGLATAGECWHANHHAFPESANVGLAPHQFDPGYLFLRVLKRFGLVWDVRGPRPVEEREDLQLMGNLNPEPARDVTADLG